MPTQKQIEANRRNALKSCGPKSPETKAISSQNRLNHGLCGEFRVLACEDQADYDRLLDSYIHSHQPVDDLERELVVRMAKATWLSARAVRCQNGSFIVQPRTDDQNQREVAGIAVLHQLDLHMRYQTQQDRAYDKAAARLAMLQKERRLAEIGFEREKRAQAQEQRRENEEIRREKRQNQHDERHTIAVATDKKKLECWEADVVTRSCRAAALLHRDMAA